MSTTTFVDGSTPVVADWLNDVDATIYQILGDGTNAPTTAAEVLTNIGGVNSADIGVTIQAHDATLDTLAATTPTAAGIALLEDADVAAQRTTLGLGTAAITDATAYATAAQGTLADTAVQPADLSSKQDTLVSGTNIKTINGSTILGSGDLSVSASITDGDKGDITVSSSGTVWTIDQKVTSGTAQATTSGTSKDFTSIPSWVTKISISIAGVSTSGTSNLQVQLGYSGGMESTGYTSGADNTGGSGVVTSSSGFLITQQNSAATLSYGLVELRLVNSSTNLWAYSSTIYTTLPRVHMGGGIKTMTGTLTQLRITTVGGTDTFDAGSVNIIYE